MSPAHVLEPTYQRLKQAILSGQWPIGAKLETKRLADDFGVSVTPVRDSLNQLVGEGLVDLIPGEGFRVPTLREQVLRDIIEVNLALLLKALSANSELGLPNDDALYSVDYVSRLSGVFSAFAEESGNRYLVESIERINERLSVIRSLENTIIPNAMQLLVALERSVDGDANSRVQALNRYHGECRARVPELITALSS